MGAPGMTPMKMPLCLDSGLSPHLLIAVMPVLAGW
jgi:hypothetical protein